MIRLQTIPGVGPRLSELVVAMIDDPGRFTNARQVSAYGGLTPRRYQSGEMDRSGGSARRAAGAEKAAAGDRLRRKQAAVALGRRVFCWCWAMLRDGTDWRDPGVTPPPRRQREPASPHEVEWDRSMVHERTTRIAV